MSVTIDKYGTIYIIDNPMAGSRMTRWLKGSNVGEALFEFSTIIADGIALDSNDEDYLYVADRYELIVYSILISRISL